MLLLSAVSAAALGAAQARADDYTDLLDILKAKGSLTQGEYRTLLAKHTHHHAAGMVMTTSDENAAAARQAALAAAASAAAAQQTMLETQNEMKKTEAMMAEPDIVRAMPYKPGAGVTMKIGNVDLNVSAIVNAFYTYSSADSATPAHVVAGGLTDASGFDSSSVRNGLLPGAIIVSAATQQDGIDLAAVFGAYPGINSTAVGALNANNGGNATALGTAGVDFRKTFVTAGTPTFGTIKIGRDIGLYGQDAILNDQTLLGVGATGGNADPGNTSLGRIGYGYIYTDFMPQITYISPVFAGFQASLGVFQPLNQFDFSGYSGVSTAHSAPMFQGRFTYDYKGADWSTHVWSGFVVQTDDGIATPAGITSKTAAAGEFGANVTLGPVGLQGYYYRAKGVGSTALFFDGLSPDGQLRDSEGGYVQAFVKPTDKLKLVASYGESSLYEAPGENNPLLLRRNESETAGAYYNLTNWLTLLGEYTHTDSHAHGPNESTANSVSAGAILFY
jgi:predicted porin